MKSPKKTLFLVAILLIPVVIFLFLKGLGDNKFSIPVYYVEGVPSIQQFDCDYSPGAYSVNWPVAVSVKTPAAFYLSKTITPERRNMIRRIVKNRETDVAIYLFTSQEGNAPITGVQEQVFQAAALDKMAQCLFASDTMEQWVLVDGVNRIRGYYNQSLEEQDRLLNELSILLIE